MSETTTTPETTGEKTKNSTEGFRVGLSEHTKEVPLMVLKPPVIVTLAERHDPGTYYKIRVGLNVWGDLQRRIISRATPVNAGTSFKLAVAEISRNATDNEIEATLPSGHLFNETSLLAVIAGLIAEQPNGAEGDLIIRRINLFYTTFHGVSVRWSPSSPGWDVSSWNRSFGRWNTGARIFFPGN